MWKVIQMFYIKTIEITFIWWYYYVFSNFKKILTPELLNFKTFFVQALVLG